MRILIAAVGRLKQGPERELAERYRKRATEFGRKLGLQAFDVVEIKESRADNVERRMLEESIAIANVIPDRAVTVILDERGTAMNSAAFAGRLQDWRGARPPAGVCHPSVGRRAGARPAPPAPRRLPYLPFPPVNPTAPAKPAIRPAAKSPEDIEALRKGGEDLEALRAAQRKAIEAEDKLKHEIEAIGNDRRQLNQQLIDTAARTRAVETEVAAAQERLKPLDTREQTLRQSLDGRRAVMAEVLGALQRIGRHPPPALMVTTEDALKSLRSAMMLGAVLPEMRHEADLLIADLAELTLVRGQIAEERDGLTRDLLTLGLERLRLSMLTDQRQKQQAEREQALDQERQRAAQLARQADSLKDLIARLDPGAAARGGEGRPGFAALNDPGRMEPAIA